jgi:hypothetical protein
MGSAAGLVCWPDPLDAAGPDWSYRPVRSVSGRTSGATGLRVRVSEGRQVGRQLWASAQAATRLAAQAAIPTVLTLVRQRRPLLRQAIVHRVMQPDRGLQPPLLRPCPHRLAPRLRLDRPGSHPARRCDRSPARPPADAGPSNPTMNRADRLWLNSREITSRSSIPNDSCPLIYQPVDAIMIILSWRRYDHLTPPS